MRILNARLREIERRLLAAENDQAGRVTEAEQRDLIQRAKLAVFMVFARMEMKSGRGEAAADVETVLAVLPPDLWRVMREQIERGKQTVAGMTARRSGLSCQSAARHCWPLTPILCAILPGGAVDVPWGRLPESPGGTSRVRPAAAGAGDTNQGSFLVERTGGQDGGSGVIIHHP